MVLMRYKYLWLLLAIAIIGTLVLINFKEKDNLQAVTVAELKNGDIQDYFIAEGIISAEKKNAIICFIKARAINQFVHSGDVIRYGQLLFSLENLSYDEIEAINNELAVAKRQLTLKKKQLDQIEKTYLHQLENSKIDLTLAKEKYDLYKELLAAQAVPRNQFTEMEMTYRKAQIQYNQIKGDLSVNEATFQYEKQTNELNIIQQKANEVREKLCLSTGSSKTTNTRHLMVYSKYSGVIISLASQSGGDTLLVNTPLAEIVEKGNLVVKAKVPEFNIKSIKIGTLVEINSPLFPKVITGAVTSIGLLEANINGPNAYNVIVQPQDINSITYQTFRYNSTVTAKFIVDEHKNTNYLPVESVLIKDSECYVYQVNQSQVAVKTAVKVGIQNDQFIEIISDLDPRFPIVIRGNLDLNHGVKVKLSN